jgi:hypothetical protein
MEAPVCRVLKSVPLQKVPALEMWGGSGARATGAMMSIVPRG